MTKEYAMQVLREMMPKFARCDTDAKRLTAIRMAINSLAERKTGRWIKDDGNGFLCSVCNSGYKNQPTCMGKPMFLFCPECGAKMEGGAE